MGFQAPSKKKINFPIRREFQEYLEKYNRAIELPLQYSDLLRHEASMPLLDNNGNDTLWETLFYNEVDREDLHESLKQIYANIMTEGDIGYYDHLTIDRIDYCTFGNSKPFRVRIINRLNDNYDHFYIKTADASRVYGLELEDIVSPNQITFLVGGNTLIEQHIPGIPGDEFMKHYLDDTVFNQIRIAKEFVKFNERCFIRLLGDMRSYNFVVDVTPDIEGSQFRMRAIDFDQQSYEGWKSFYLPQYFKENNPIIYMGIKHMTARTLAQYQMEERSMIAARVRTEYERYEQLMDAMSKEILSKPEKVEALKKDLAQHHGTDAFDECTTMGEIVGINIELVLQKNFQESEFARKLVGE
jgi:hypothetical protein